MRARLSTRLPTTLVAGLAASLLTAVPAVTTTGGSAAAAERAEPLGTTTDACLESVPEPGEQEPVEICYTLFKPAGASRDHRVPLIMHSHGWGGSRTTDPEAFRQWLTAGYGVLSFDQRGFGESGGHAHVENPRFEGRDNLKLISRVAQLPWVKQDGPGDPRLGAIGGSYGGGYQYLGAFLELQRRGTPVYDALAPEITWNDLNESLAPQGVVRSEWAYALSAASVPTDALPTEVYTALAEGSVTGEYPDGSGPSGVDLPAFFRRNGPAFHVSRGRKLDIPVLMGQGTTDTLFNLRQGLRNWRTTLTAGARQQSMFVGYNGGHTLPAVLPQGTDVASDPCSERLAGGDFARLARTFMDEQLKGRDRDLGGYGRLHLATPGNACRTISSPAATAVARPGDVAIPSGAGAPIAYELEQGPLRVAGNASLEGELTALGLQNRAFYGLGIGTSPADARLVQNNVYPLNVEGPVQGEHYSLELPSVAVDVPQGQNLYLIATPVSDTFAGMSTRTPGAVVFSDTVVHLPVRGR